jgi:hypothetical protein
MDKVCKNCKFWKKPELHYQRNRFCDRVDRISDILFDITSYAHDDSGLSAVLETGPDFGCVLFESRK